MSVLHDRFAALVPALRAERDDLVAKHGDRTISQVSVRQAFGGMRGVRALVCDTSVVDPDKGLLIRGVPVAHLADCLPEDVFFLLLTGERPDAKALRALRDDLSGRDAVPESVWRVVEAMPKDAHPMTTLGAAVLALGERSVFRRRVREGMPRDAHWEPALDDALDLLAALPTLAAAVYRRHYGKGARIEPDPNLDWAANLARMLGSEDEKFRAYLRLATVVQSDHEGAHASALACHTVGSTLADLYTSVAAGWGALSGPRHGLASQTCLEWVLAAIDRYGGVPSESEIREYAGETLRAGRVIPGYGHAVLRGQDPRYLAILAFGEKNAPRDRVFQTVTKMSKVIPALLMEQGKVKNPWPNVDGINGALFHHYGITELPFYTVFFAVALAFGFSAQYVIHRALGTPITRPRSVTTAWIRKQFSG